MPTRIVFIDSRLTGCESLIASLPDSVETFIVDARHDGLEQMAGALAGRTGIDAIHVLSHGRPGALFLGSTLLEAKSLALHELELASIKAALTLGADILLYGCNVAQGEEGIQFISSLAQYTGADVAASDDVTGAGVLGGDADLEIRVGDVAEKLLLDEMRLDLSGATFSSFSFQSGTLTATGAGPGTTPQEIVDLALANIGRPWNADASLIARPWEKHNGLSFVYGVTNLAGLAYLTSNDFFSFDPRTVDVRAPTLLETDLTFNGWEWVVRHGLNPEGEARFSFGSLMGILRPGDVVNAHSAGPFARDEHTPSFIVVTHLGGVQVVGPRDGVIRLFSLRELPFLYEDLYTHMNVVRIDQGWVEAHPGSQLTLHGTTHGDFRGVEEEIKDAAGNTMETATALTLGGSIHGAVGVREDTEDYFKVVASGTGRVTASLAGLSSDIDLEARSGSATVASARSGSTSNEALSFDVVQGQTYFLRVHPYKSNLSNYTLTTGFVEADTTAPILNATTPQNNAPGTATGANLVLTFNEAVRAAAGNLTIHNAGGSVWRSIDVTDTAQVSFSGSTVTINPTMDLVEGSGYYVLIGSGAILDTAGNAYAGLSSTSAFNFSTLAAVDTAGNTLAAATTLAALDSDSIDGSVGAGADTDDYFTFVASGSGQLTVSLTGLSADIDLKAYNAGGSLVGSSRSAGAADETLSFDVVSGQTYYLHVTLYQSSASNYSMAATFVADTTAPVLAGTAPTDNATEVVATSNLVFTFNEAVRAGAGSVTIHNAGGTLWRTIAVTDTAQMGFSGSTVTVNPGVDLADGSGYYVLVDAGAILDNAGNSFGGISSPTAFNFTTVAAPADNAGNTLGAATTLVVGGSTSGTVGAGADTDDYFKFVAGSSGRVTASLTGLSSDIDLGAYSSSGVLIGLSGLSGVSNETVAIDVVSGQTYSLRVDPVQSSSSSYTLSTSFATVDTAAPVINSFSPADNTNGVAIAANLVLTFNEAVRAGAGSVTIYNGAGTVWRTIAVTDTTQVTFSGNTLTLNPAVDLAEGSAYYVLFDRGAILDTAGNAHPGISSAAAFNVFTFASADNAGNTLATSTTLAIGGTVGSAAGSTADPRDWFRFVASGTGSLTVVLTGLTSDLDIEGNDGSGTLIAASRGSGTLSETFSMNVVSGQPYYLHIFPFQAGVASNYLLSTSLDDNTFATSVSLALGGSTSGSVGLSGDTDDYFRFVAGANGRVTATLSGLSSDIDLVAFNSSGNSIAVSNNSGSLNETVGFDVVSGQTYYLKVDPFTSASSNYSLAASFEPTDNEGNALATATTLVVGDFINGAVGLGTDTDDYFKFVASGNGRVTATLTGLSSDADLGAYSSGGAQIALSALSGLANETVSIDAVSGQTYHLRVDPFQANSNASYRLATTFTAADATAPLLVGTTPLDNATTVATAEDLVLTFNEAVRAGVGSVTIYTAGGSVWRTIAVTGTSQVGFSGSTVTINPAVDLHEDSGYYVVIDAGAILDTAGNAYAGLSSATAFNFNTAAVADNSGDTLATATTLAVGGSASGPVGFGADTDDYFGFVASGTGEVTASLTRLTADIDLEAYDGSGTQVGSSRLAGASSEALSFDVVSGQAYYLRVYPYQASSSSYSLATSFVAGDTTAPVLTSTTPADDATGFATGSNLVLTFDEAVRAGTGSLTVYNASGSVWRTIGVTDTAQVGFLGSTVTINPAMDLVQGSGYYVTMDSGAILDTAGNASGGISSPTAFNFNTPATADNASNTFEAATTLAVVSSTSGDVGVGADTDDYFTFVASGDGRVTASLTGLSGDIDLEAFEADGTELGSSRLADTSSERVSFEVQAGQTYYLHVFPYQQDASNYRIDTSFVTQYEPYGAVTLSGDATQGHMLTASNTLADANGMGAVSYQWLADSAVITPFSTSATLVLTQSEVGRAITLRAGYTDGLGHFHVVTGSAAGAPVANVNDAPTGSVSIAGNAALGRTLTASNTVADLDGLGTITYQWRAGGDAIDGATGASYTLTNSEVGKVISVLARYTDALGSAESIASAETGAVVLRLTFGLDGMAYHWKSHALLSGLTISATDATNSATNRTTAGDGRFDFAELDEGSYGLAATRATTDIATAVNSADALAALRIAVGVNPNPDPDGAGPLGSLRLSPYQLIAADVNDDGRVNSADALAILRMAVNAATAPAKKWIFVDEALDLWTGDAGTGSSSLTRAAATWNQALAADLTAGNLTRNLVGVLRGDVNGSWVPPTGSSDLDVTSPAYFQALGTQLGVPTDVWGV